MTDKPDKDHRYRVNTGDGIRYLNETEKDKLMDAVFAPLPEAERVKGAQAYPCNECGRVIMPRPDHKCTDCQTQHD